MPNQSIPLAVVIVITLVFLTLIWFIARYFIAINKEAINPLEATAKNFAIKAHKSTNHRYDPNYKNLPYSYHLRMVRDYAYKYKNLISTINLPVVLAGCWVHDCIEDARLTYNDVLKVCGKEIAELSFALTNDKGRTRAERASENYYKGIKNTPYADFIKICDRLANIKYSYETNSNMLEKYRSEHKEFKNHLYFEPYKLMFDEMEQFLGI